MELLLLLLLFFFLFSFLPLSSTQANDTTLPTGSITRTTKQQLLATLPPGNPSSSDPFLSSPSGKYAAYFLRHGNDFCYIKVAEINATDSIWESNCVPVSISNACSLIFSDSGLEILDGSSSAWSTEAQFEYPLQNLELDDEGDMRITDEDGESAWNSTDEPRQNQHCGESSGLPSMGRVGPMPEGVNGSGIGYGGQPLVDSTPYDSGSLKPVAGWVGMGRLLVLCLTVLGGVLF